MGKLNFNLPSADDLFSTQEEREESKNKRVIRDIPISDIDGFPNHPFCVQDDEDMVQLVESIKERGVETSALVRLKKDGRYELISGHRRKRACEILGLETLKCEILDIDDNEATIIMVESNLIYRSCILPSNKAFAYKMQLDALKHQGKRADLTSAPLEPKLRSNYELSKKVGESESQIKRYIRLTELITEFLNMVDENKFPFRSAVEISYLKKSEQEMLLEALENGCPVPSLEKAAELKRISQSKGLTKNLISKTMTMKKSGKSTVKRENTFYTDKLKTVIPSFETYEEAEDYIYKACIFYRESTAKRENGGDCES